MDLKIFDRMESEAGYIRSFPVIFSQARPTLIDEEEPST